MEDAFFKEHIRRCQVVSEETSYTEVFLYSDPQYDTIQDDSLQAQDFDDFLDRKGTFTERHFTNGVSLIAGIRLIIQVNAQDPETFGPNVISLRPEQYASMVQKMNLPRQDIESTSSVGPIFWYTWAGDGHLQIIYRKADVRKKGKTRGWQLSLCHDMKTGITSGFYKGTSSSGIVECLDLLKESISDLRHAMLLPVIIFTSSDLGDIEIKQRDARGWLRRIEHTLSARSNANDAGYIQEGIIELDMVSTDSVECHSQVLWKRAVSYLEICDCMKEATLSYWEKLSKEEKSALQTTNRTVLARLDFASKRWRSLETYADTTLRRLDLQRSTLYNTMAQKDSKLNVEMAGVQRKLAAASKHDSTTMKIISLLGTLFLPGAFIASIFSTTFFNFQDAGRTVSRRFWIYWVFTIPITLIFLVGWYVWERKRAAKHKEEDAILELGNEAMEEHRLRRRIAVKERVWRERRDAPVVRQLVKSPAVGGVVRAEVWA